MFVGMSTFSFLLFVIVVICPRTANTDENSENIRKIQRIMLAYDKLLTYVILYAPLMNLDGAYGIVLAGAQLELMSQMPIDSNMLSDINILKKKTRNTIKILLKSIALLSTDYQIISQMMDEKLWVKNVPLCEGQLMALDVPKWDLQTLTKMGLNGMPNESLSNRCISTMIKLGEIRKPHDCSFTDDVCQQVFQNPYVSNGYPLTHKLLYWQIAETVNCRLNQSTPQDIRILCSRILSEAKNIAYNHYPEMMRDLFIEQIDLCGREGFVEFLEDEWINEILSWQTERGCFRQKWPETKKQRVWRVKRTIAPIGFGCEAHITGLTAASMMLFLRKYVTDPSWNLCGVPNEIAY